VVAAAAKRAVAGPQPPARGCDRVEATNVTRTTPAAAIAASAVPPEEIIFSTISVPNTPRATAT
jgi:hypothetical protein